MDHILVYGDSLSWGIIPGTRERLSFEERWPGVFEGELKARGREVRVIENCLNGRRTVWNDPFKAGRNGREGLAQVMEINSPLKLVILMLGSNDFQYCHPFNDAWAASQGIAALVKEIRGAPIEPTMPMPPILVVAPPPMKQPQGMMAPKFAGAESRCSGIAEAYKTVCDELGCPIFDAGNVIETSSIDGVHIDKGQHRVLALALADYVNKLLYA